MKDEHVIVGPYIEDSAFLTSNVYKTSRRGAERHAKSIDRELAEGPTLFLPDNYYGPVELWPLVVEKEN